CSAGLCATRWTTRVATLTSIMPPISPRAFRQSIIGAAVAIATVVVAPGRVLAQGGVLLQGVADVEGWSTNATSNLLTRNLGRGAELGRLVMWGAYEPFSGLVLYAQGHAEVGSARANVNEEKVYAEQFGVRYTPSRAFVVDAGGLSQ